MIVDDHEITKDGLRQVLAGEDGFVIVGTAGDGEQAVQMAAQLCPDVVITDLAMPKLDGLKAAKQIKDQLPGVIIILFTGFDYRPYIATALECGVTGFLSKARPSNELIIGIKAACAGQTVFSNLGTMPLIGSLSGTTLAGGMLPVGDLTPHEMSVLKLTARGMITKNIARETGMSERTVQTHLDNISRKLNTTTRTEAVTRALRIGILSLEDLP